MPKKASKKAANTEISPQPSGRERRSSRRVLLAVRVELQGEGNEPFFLFTLDVSSGGLFLLCQPPLPALQRELQMTISLPGVRPLLPVRGKVVRQVTQGTQTGVGVEFVEIPLEFKQLLDQAIATLPS